MQINNNEAIKQVRNGDIEKAIETLKEGLKIWYESPEINYNIGLLYFDLGNYNEAGKHSLRATKYDSAKSFPIEKWAIDSWKKAIKYDQRGKEM